MKNNFRVNIKILKNIINNTDNNINKYLSENIYIFLSIAIMTYYWNKFLSISHIQISYISITITFNWLTLKYFDLFICHPTFKSNPVTEYNDFNKLLFFFFLAYFNKNFLQICYKYYLFQYLKTFNTFW